MKFRRKILLSIVATFVGLGGVPGSPVYLSEARGSEAPSFDGGRYRIELSDKVRIKIGGAVKVFNRNELTHNQKVGRHTITPEQFQKLSASIPKTYTFKVNPRRLGPLQEIYLSSENAASTKGLYNWKTKEFLFAQFKKPVKAGNGRGGVIRGTAVKGKLSRNYNKIKNGEITSGFLAAGKGIAISADATFFYHGAKI